MLKVLIICIVVGLAISAVVVFVSRRSENRRLENTYPKVEARFAKLKAGEEGSRYYLDGELAETIHDFSIWAAFPPDERIELNRICRNPQGEYFRVIVSRENDNTYINHLTANQAALALKGITDIEQPKGETFKSSNSSDTNNDKSAATQSHYRVVIPGRYLVKPQSAGKAGSDEDLNTPAILRPITRLPLESFRVMSTLGFICAFVLLYLLIPENGYVTTSDLIRFVTNVFLPYFAILMIAFKIFKRRQNEILDGRHWILRILSIPIKSGYGLLLGVLVYNWLVWINHS